MSCTSWNGTFLNDGCKIDNVLDAVCVSGSRTLTDSVAEQVYVANVAVTATGYLKILSTPPNAVVTPQFLLNNIAVAIPPVIESLSAGEVIAFTVKNFNEITLTMNTTGTLTYELSLTPRYTI